MNISLAQAAEVLGKTSDELMFLVQANRIQAGVDQDTLAWTFQLEEVLTLKKTLEEESLQEEKQFLTE
jgi:hypothetical protein